MASDPPSMVDIQDLIAGATAPRGSRLGVFGALVVVAIGWVLLAFPLGVAAAAAWWLFEAGWNVIA